MPLDIFITDDNELEIIPLFMEEYDIIMEIVSRKDDFILLRSKLRDYYGESEVYLNDLENLKAEVEKLTDIFKVGYSDELLSFLDQFYILIAEAIKKNKTIKFVGD